MSWTGSGSNVLRKGHLKSCWDEQDKIAETYYPQDDISPARNCLENTKVTRPDFIIYTDVSRMDGATGCAYAACKGDLVIAE